MVRNESIHQYMLGAMQLVDTMLNMHKQCALATMKADSTLGCIRQSVTRKPGKGIFLLYFLLYW